MPRTAPAAPRSHRSRQLDPQPAERDPRPEESIVSRGILPNGSNGPSGAHELDDALRGASRRRSNLNCTSVGRANTWTTGSYSRFAFSSGVIVWSARRVAEDRTPRGSARSARARSGRSGRWGSAPTVTRGVRPGPGTKRVRQPRHGRAHASTVRGVQPIRFQRERARVCPCVPARPSLVFPS
jgi:hypothetical protein